MKKKILWLFPHLKFWVGGGSKFLLETASRVNNNENYEVVILTNLGRSDLLKRFQEEKLKVILINRFACTNNFYYWFFFPFFLFIEIFIVVYYTYKEKPDYFFANLFPSNLIALIVSKIFKKDYYFFCFDPFPFFHSDFYINSQKLFLRLALKFLSITYGWLDIIASSSSKKIIVSNKIVQKEVKKIYKKDSFIAPMVGVDVNFFRKISKNNYFIKRFPKKILISHATDYTAMKRTDLIIKAMEYVVKKFPHTLLLISSTQPNNPQKKELDLLVKEKGLQNNVIFLGLIDYRLLPHFYSASVVYVSCAFDKSIGASSINTPVKEASACETPIIRPRFHDGDIIDGETGFIVDPRKSHKLANKICFLIANRKLGKIMGKKGRNLIVNNFTWEKAVEKILKIIN